MNPTGGGSTYRSRNGVATKPATSIVTRKYLAAEIAETHEMPKKQAETIADDVFGLLISHLKAGIGSISEGSVFSRLRAAADAIPQPEPNSDRRKQKDRPSRSEGTE